MQPNDPGVLKDMQAQAVDLNEAMDEREKARAAEEAKAEAATAAAARAWERGMRRTFKGIFPAPSRRAFMRAYIKEQQ